MTNPIAVIGGSASGLFAASLLAQKGRDVTVYERARSLDPAPRTLIVTNSMRNYLGSVGAGAIVNEINRFELFANGKVAEVELGAPDLIVERSALLRELTKETEQAGGKVEFGRRFLGLRRSGGSTAIRLKADGGEYDAPAATVIGADGARSAVGRAARWPHQPTVPLLQAIVSLPPDLERHTARVWFRPEDTPYFYWLIPESETHGALGVIGEDSSAIKSRLDRFLEEKELVATEYQAARIPRYSRWTRVKKTIDGQNVYLVGDAAGQVKVTTVGGLVTGFRGALGVVESILHGSSRHLRSLRLELEAHRLLRRIMHSFNEDDYCKLIDLINDATATSLKRHTRDEAPMVLWKLAMAQPRFMLFATRRLITGSF